MLFQLLVMFGTAYIGQFISNILPFPFPGTIIASLILFILLQMKIIKIDKLKGIIDISHKYLALFFVPVGVGILEYATQFSIEVWLKIFLLIILSTAATMIITGKASDFTIKIFNKGEIND
ncbi:MAG: CidA/LrgA family protein [Peptoniphilus sp.]|uniref:CidA/LrgA family protein n=1 Tax=Peptoniphilus sp. TaxID=1971214 RepID=UPI002A75AF54|nr:CidA/LrgA family protein [Peptoniphilus sp.]MDY2987874.1 CidA/LrgA family protein [Peptoniphilus sp.]